MFWAEAEPRTSKDADIANANAAALRIMTLQSPLNECSLFGLTMKWSYSRAKSIKPARLLLRNQC